MWMKRAGLQRAVGRSRLLRRLSIGGLARLELLLLGGHKDAGVLAAIRQCRQDVESLLTGNEAFLLYALARAQRSLGGSMAEVGVFEGSSAELICKAKGESPLHLFDTFEGLPQPRGSEGRVLERGQFAAGLAAVRSRLASYVSVHLHAGLFPQSATGLEAERFSLVHLDVDLFTSTLAGLEFFYPRMLTGGIIVSHDYSMLPGVAEAFTAFLADKPEAVIELPTTQGMLVKI
jgi:O-methyltransferase